MLLLQFGIMPFCDGVTLEIALPQSGIIMFASCNSRLTRQFDIFDQAP